MKAFKKFITYLLVLAAMASVLPANVSAEENIYSIKNGYLNFMFNADTGGFSVETEEGNPKKLLDNNIPLLYSEDRERSNGTSFLTVRIGDKDYVFGQDYGFFGMSSKLGTVQIAEEGRLISIPWTIKDITVTMKVALATDENSDITGNAGISVEVLNNSKKSEQVSVRLLLDTALGNDIDAPYFVVDDAVRPTMTETEFAGEELPSQIRCVDSLANPSKLSYILTKGWNGGTVASRVIMGHWANLANTRYEYKADNYCDFTNYSNDYREPDSAAAIYWENKTLGVGESFCGEMLYGIGNLSNPTHDTTGINITAGRVELSDDGKSYKNNGEFEVTVEIDNTADDSVKLGAALLNITYDDKKLAPVSGNPQVTYNEIGKEVLVQKYTMRALPQADLGAATIYVSLTATANLADGTQKTVETAGERSVILPSVTGSVPDIQMNKLNPEIVWTGGEKAVTITGDMKAFEVLANVNQGWDLRLKHTTSSHSVLIEKKNIAFLDEEYENMSFSTDEELSVGYYQLVFEFTDPALVQAFGKSITCAHKLQVSADEKYRLKSYGIIALVRSTGTTTDYDFFTFGDEGEYLKFYHGEQEKTGEIHKEKLRYDFGTKEAIGEHEILLTVRANLREMERGEGKNKERYWQANPADGDVIINNMLSYEGDSPIEIFEKNGRYTVNGDGLLKVVNSINVWRSKWSFSAQRGIVYTLDGERLGDCYINEGNPFRLSLDGAATMIQSVGGFLVDLKYGEMSSQWYENSDGMVTYGIGFGGSISIPISAKKKKDEKSKQETDLTSDQEDISDAMNSLFDESLSADQEDISGDMNSLFDETPPKTTSTGDKIKKDTKLSEGQLSAEVNNVMFGENGDVKDGVVTVDDTGFIGIDATMSLALPSDVLGSLVSNAPGIYASMTINTIENIYELNVGLNIKIIECEGILAFKEVKVKNKETILPDKIEFYIRDGLKIPLVPPVLYMTGLGGGVNELADTIGGQFDSLPPITLLLFTRLEAISTLVGDFDAKINLEGLSLKGDMQLKFSDKLLDMDAGISARWIEPWELELYGNVSIIDGLIKGGITVTIADDYFYGYIFASICIPDSIPLVGGKELAGVEAAVSHEFIGANIKIIGIKFGVIYYWGDKVSFGKNIDLSPPSKGDGTKSLSAEGYYGTNVHALPIEMLYAPQNGEAYKEAKADIKNAGNQDALLFEIPYTGTGIPQAGEITLFNKDGKEIRTYSDDGSGGGNMLVQNREDGRFIYVTVTDKGSILDGTWTVRYTTPDIEITSFSVNGVDDITEIKSCSLAYDPSDVFSPSVSWTIEGGGEQKGNVDVYLTEDKDILEKIKTADNKGDTLGINVLHKNDIQLKSGSEKITLPDTFQSGKYYAVTTVSTTEGISLAISGEAMDFVNPKLPKPVESVHINYGGNGNLFVSVKDAQNPDYTHYLAEITASDGTVLNNNFGQFERGENFVFGKEAYLEPGKEYYVKIKTLREEYGTQSADGEYKKIYYYGDGVVASDKLVMPEPDMPELLEVKTNFDTSKEYINQNSIIIEYTFENDVFVQLSVNGQKAYSDNKMKKEWKFVLDDLEDGDYVIDFTAYTKTKDHISGKDTDIKDAQLGFSIDTSAPVLSLARRYADSAASSDDEKVVAVFGTNTVFAENDGSYRIEGLTERTAELSIDGKKDGITIAENGGFEFGAVLADGENYKKHVLHAEDAAGNVSELTVYVVRRGSFAFSGLELRSDSTITTENGIKKIKMKNGADISLWVVLSAQSGTTFEPDAEMIDWSVLYEKNRIAFESGRVTALSPGETAVKAKLNTLSMQTEDGTNVSGGFADLVVLEIANNSKSDLADKIEEAMRLLENDTKASQSKRDALQAAIDRAKDVLADSACGEEEYTKEVTNLTQAIAAFKRTESQSGQTKRGSSAVSVYNIKVAETEHGTVTLSNTKAYHGTSVTVTAVPDEGYAVRDILINGVSVGRSEVYTIKSITQDTEVKVIFGEKDELPFDDVTKSDWYWETVKEAYENNYMNGVSATKFAPRGKLSRAMFVTVLYRMEGSPYAEKSDFADLEPGAYYEDAVAWASANGIVNGITEELFAPANEITREQMAAMLYRYAKYKDMDMSQSTNILSYSDYEKIAEYAIEPMQWAADRGILRGRTDTTLDPKDTATRAEAATVFVRFARLMNK